MTDEMNPERLDAVLDAAASPETDEERAMLHMAASLREAAPRPSEALRERVAGLGEPVGRIALPRRPLWKRLNVMAPALGAVIAAVVAVGVLTTSGGGGSRLGSGSGGAADTAADQFKSAGPPPAAAAPAEDGSVMATATAESLSRTLVAPTLTVERGGLDDALAEIESAAGGPQFVTEQSRTATSAQVTVSVPAAREVEVIRALTTVGDWSDPQALGGHAAGTPIILLVTEAPDGP